MLFIGNVSNVGVVDSYFKGGNGVGGVCGFNDGGTFTNCYNSGSVSGSEGVGGVCGFYGGGTFTNCYYDSTVYTGGKAVSGEEDTETVTGKTTEQFKNGEVCYLLNGDQKVLVWGQTLGENGNAYPVFKTAENTVYCGYDGCEATVQTYSNSQLRATNEHSYTGTNHACIYCKKAFAVLAVEYAAIGTAVDKAYKVDADGKIGDEADVNVTAESNVITCAIALNGSEPTVDSYELKIFKKGDTTTPLAETGKSKYKKIALDDTTIDINIIQIVYELENNTDYTVELTLYDSEGEICTQQTYYTPTV